MPGLKPNAWIPTVDASPFDAGTAYVAADQHQDDDYAPHAYKTTDYGKTWTPITGDLPAKGYVHVVREDPKAKGLLLYSAPRSGVWASWDGGAIWMWLRHGPAAVPVRDIQIHPRDNDLILATHGRGIYILDDITALQQLERGGGGRCDTVRIRAPPCDGRSGTATATSARRSGSARIRRAGAIINY